MKCPDDCPLLGECETRAGSVLGRITDMMIELENNSALVATNRNTFEILAKLPDSQEVIEARALLQGAIEQTDQAREKIGESISAFEKAIDKNQAYAQVVRSECHGKPYYTENPSSPGTMILRCASPGVYEL